MLTSRWGLSSSSNVIKTYVGEWLDVSIGLQGHGQSRQGGMHCGKLAGLVATGVRCVNGGMLASLVVRMQMGVVGALSSIVSLSSRCEFWTWFGRSHLISLLATYTYRYIYICIYIYIYMYACIDMYVYVYITWAYLCIYIYIYI